MVKGQNKDSMSPTDDKEVIIHKMSSTMSAILGYTHLLKKTLDSENSNDDVTRRLTWLKMLEKEVNVLKNLVIKLKK